MKAAHPSDPTVLFHRPGASHLERLIPEEGGPVGFRMHPWEGSQGHGDLVLRGTLVQDAAVFGDERPFYKPAARALSGTSREAHIESVQQAIAAIATGSLEKVVVSSILTVEAADLDAEAVVRRLSQAHPDSFSWLVRHPEVGTWFGSSPEPLVQGQWPRLSTACLAGTRMAHTGSQSDPWTDKERHEQQLVTDSVLSALQQSDCRNIQVGERMTVRYGPIEHLRTMVTFDADGALGDVMAALHPTPLSAVRHGQLRSRSSTAMKATTGPTIPGGSDWKMATTSPTLSTCAADASRDIASLPTLEAASQRGPIRRRNGKKPATNCGLRSTPLSIGPNDPCFSF